jgi:hypothetical protein
MPAEGDMPVADPILGSCLCGAIGFRLDLPVKELRACHCRNCQKASGTGGSVNAVLPSAAFTITRGTPKRYSARADSGRLLHRYFCGDCGSPIYSQRDTRPDIVVVRAGAFDDAGDMKITAHIWTKSAPPWAHIDPASEQHPGQPDAPKT